MDLKATNKVDPLKRNVEKDAGLEHMENSPMDPPEVYEKGSQFSEFTYDVMAKPLQIFIDEHKVASEIIEKFEKALAAFKESNYQISQIINENFRNFFEFFDNKIIQHNLKEERVLFPILHKKLIAEGEHGTGEKPQTAVDIMEDDHIKFIQLGALTFNFLGLATRIQDPRSKLFIYDVAYNNGKELIEMLRLHIFREENTLFPLAQKYLQAQEFGQMELEMNQF